VIDYPADKPCWAPGAAEYLESLLTGEERAREWGGGASTIWLADKVKFISVIEDDPKWIKVIEAETDHRVVQVLHRSRNAPDYTHCGPNFNLWLIDGYRRIDCLKVVDNLKKSGDIVVADDALDYCEHVLSDGDFTWGTLKRFAQPHPHAGIPINPAKYSHLRNTVRKVHADTTDTWVWRV
jgi:hypothetical protein